MHHCEDVVLAAAALGETLDPADAEHIATCADCNGEVQELRSIAHLASVGATETVAPPPRVWQAIEAQVASAHTPEVRQRRPWLRVVAAAASVAAIGAVTLSLVNTVPNEQVVAAAPLAALPGGPGGAQSGEAQVYQTEEGMMLTIATAGLSNPSGYYEAWLLDPAGGGVIALGVVPVDTPTVSLPLPDGADLSIYSAVDVSDEPFDGNPGHSSVSVLRGVFNT